MPYLRQLTSQIILFGPCLDKDDGVTEEVSLTLAQADMRLSKDGGAFAQKNASGNATHDSDGWYNTTLNTIDTNTVGELRLNVHQPANMLPVWDKWWVIEEDIYDAIYGASAAGFNASMRVNVGGWMDSVPNALISGRVDVEVASRYKKNTATNNIMFVMRDASDHVTPKTGLTVSGTRSLDGASFGAVTGSIAEIANGVYQIDASAADMNADDIVFRFTATGAEDQFLSIRTSA